MKEERNKDTTCSYFGELSLDSLLPDSINPNDPPNIILIEGPRGTFKSILATNFLITGIIKKREIENALLIRLGENLNFEPNCIVSTVINKDYNRDNLKEDRASPFTTNTSKVKSTSWGYYLDNNHKNSVLIELAFTSGTLLPKEFIQHVQYTLMYANEKNYEIKRVVLDDVSLIGVSYPLLRYSRTSADLFLPAFVHLMRLYKVNLIMTGTIGDLAEANEAVSRARSLSDTVLSCRFREVFGDRHVLITGEGLLSGTAKSDADRKEAVPGVIRLEKQKKPDCKQPFRIDLKFLEGLVGFDSSVIHRPGLTMHIYQDTGQAHKQYNKEIEKLVRFAFANPRPGRPTTESGADVRLVTYDSLESEAMHDSLGVLQGAPIERTVVCTVDEFWQPNPNKGRSIDHRPALVNLFPAISSLTDDILKRWKKQQDFFVEYRVNNTIYAIPLYANVLLLAYRKGVLNEYELLHNNITKTQFQANTDRGNPKSWNDLLTYTENSLPSVLTRFDYDRTAPETLSCALMDVFAMGLAESDFDKLFIPEKQNPVTVKTHEYDLQPNSPVINEAKALHDLFLSANKCKNGEDQYKNGKAKGCKDAERCPRQNNTGLCPHAAAYLCWYSQLRNLLNQHPELSTELDVCALPGRGFRGDWFVGIVNGSVSVNLGLEVIRILSSETEEYKRFAKGIGLPVSNKFRTVAPGGPDFFAWPHSQLRLNAIIDIHDKARSRSKIKDYKLFHPILNTICSHLAATPDNKPYDPTRLYEILRRIPEQIKVMRP